MNMNFRMPLARVCFALTTRDAKTGQLCVKPDDLQHDFKIFHVFSSQTISLHSVLYVILNPRLSDVTFGPDCKSLRPESLTVRFSILYPRTCLCNAARRICQLRS